MAKKMKSEINGKSYCLSVVAGQIRNGSKTLATCEAALPQDVFAKLSKMVGREKKAGPKGYKLLTGQIRRETGVAVLFRVHDGEFSGFENWFPKSQCQIFVRAMGPLDQINVPAWLIEKKFK